MTCSDNSTSVVAYNRRFAAKELADYLQSDHRAKIAVVDKVDAKKIEAGGVIFVGPSRYTDTLNFPRSATISAPAAI